MDHRTEEEKENALWMIAKILGIIFIGIAVATSYHCLKANQDKTGVGIEHAKVPGK